MPFDVNNQYSGTYYGKDRLGYTTPDVEATEILRPFLVNPYPAPWLPIRRRDEGHPVAAGVVLSCGYLVGQDSSGGLVPAGIKSGSTGAGGDYSIVAYGSDDVGFSYNPQTGAYVANVGEYAVIGAPSDISSNGTTITTTLNGGNTTITVTAGSLGQGTLSATTGLSVGSYIAITGVTGVKRITALNTTTKVATFDSNCSGAVAGAAVAFGVPTLTVNGVAVTPTATDVAFAQTCTLIPNGTARPIGYAVRNVFQYLGAVTVSSNLTGGMSYTQNGMAVPNFKIHNYMHEPGTALQTMFGLRVPYIGKDLNDLNNLAAAQSLSTATYTYDDFSRSFAHFVGTVASAGSPAPGTLYPGCSIVADDENGYIGSGHFRPFDSTKHSYDQICGRVLAIEQMYPPKDYADRVRTQFDRAQNFVGPYSEPNPTTQLMGGSATRGMDYAINLATKGLLRKMLDAGVAAANIPMAAGTYIWMGIRTI